MKSYEPGDILRYGPEISELMIIVSLKNDNDGKPYYFYYDFYDDKFYETYTHVMEYSDSIYTKVA